MQGQNQLVSFISPVGGLYCGVCILGCHFTPILSLSCVTHGFGLVFAAMSMFLKVAEVV